MHDCNKTLDAGLIFHLHHRMGEKWHLTISRVIPPKNDQLRSLFFSVILAKHPDKSVPKDQLQEQ